jgi:hypothetical protein
MDDHKTLKYLDHDHDNKQTENSTKKNSAYYKHCLEKGTAYLG